MSEKSKWSGLDSATLSLGVWLVVLGFGGGLLALYYFRLGYFPDVEWQQSLNYLAVLSIIGGSVVAIYSLLLIVPGLIWNNFLVFDPDLKKVLCWGKDGASGHPCVRSVCLNLASPFLLFMFLVHVALLRGHSLNTHIIIWLLLFGICYFYFYRRIRSKTGCIVAARQQTPVADNIHQENPSQVTIANKENKEFCSKHDNGETQEADEDEDRIKPCYEHDKKLSTGEYHKDCRSIWLKLAIWFGLSLLAAYASLTLIFMISYPPHSDTDWSDGAIMLLFCTVGVSLSSILFVLLYEKSKTQALVAAMAIALTLLVTGELVVKEAAFSLRIMNGFGFGGDCAYSLLLTDRGQEIVLEHGLTPTALTTNESACEHLKIDNVEILSRLGSQYLLRQGDSTFSMPKKEVTSWSKKAGHCQPTRSNKEADKSFQEPPIEPSRSNQG